MKKSPASRRATVPPAAAVAPTPDWSVEQSRELYRLDAWGNGFFGVNADGEITVRLRNGGHEDEVSLMQILRSLRTKSRNFHLPALFRFPDLLFARIAELNEAFKSAIKSQGYQGRYHGVYPVKVNQQQQVIKEITEYGRQYHYGLEVGSKPELLAALAFMHDRNALLVCNGYKDSEFIDLALQAKRMGLRVMLVIEMPPELDLILERSKVLGIEPNLGLRIKLSTKGSGHWSESAGDRSPFGLNFSQTITVVDDLKNRGKLHLLKMLHYHQGSQIPKIATVRLAAQEASRVYVNLVKEGAPMGLLNLGGGLAVDYSGTRQADESSMNYTLQEYCADVVEAVQKIMDEANVEHPDIVTESGRAMVAYYSVLVFDILDVNRTDRRDPLPKLSRHAPDILKSMTEVVDNLDKLSLQESYHDIVFYRDELLTLFRTGIVSLRERAVGDQIYWTVLNEIARRTNGVTEIPGMESKLADFYYGNFSMFQSLPDAWAIKQFFPVAPIHRLQEKPTRQAVISDVTCDCEGTLNCFLGPKGTKRSTIPLHEIQEGQTWQDYLMGVFLVGAYQETLGDLHNLLGDTSVVTVRLRNGRISFSRQLPGDTAAEVLSYLEYEPRNLLKRFRALTDEAVENGKINESTAEEFYKSYRKNLKSYTYFTS
ncbi:MAG: biosynthetic arginine decarboxylase [Verrucomicrobiales bacterium]|nr:biosynthetic arginine decarboxylase [Verrucomicrobiales bacterium]